MTSPIRRVWWTATVTASVGWKRWQASISGICAGNYDVTDIFVDSTLKIIGQDMKALEEFVGRMNKLSKEDEVNIILLVSADKGELPEG